MSGAFIKDLKLHSESCKLLANPCIYHLIFTKIFFDFKSLTCLLIGSELKTLELWISRSMLDLFFLIISRLIYNPR